MRKALLLCAALLLGVLLLFGCAKTDAEKLCGVWETRINYSEELKSQLGDEERYFDIDSFELDMRFTFKDDGTYLFELDGDSVGASLESLRGPLKQGIVEMFEPVASTLSMTVDDYLELLGQSIDEVIDEMIKSLDVEGFADAVRTEGYYFLENGRLYISSSKMANLDPSVYYIFAFEGDKSFTLSGIVGDDGGLLDFPAEFTKIK